MTTIPKLVQRLLKACGRKLEEFAWIVPHQANARIIQAAAKRLGAPEERFYMNIEEYANTSSASIPIALAEMSERGLLKRGDLLMLLGFGAGLTYGRRRPALVAAPGPELDLAGKARENELPPW